MRRILLSVVFLLGAEASAQKEVLFGSGKPPVFREEEIDRRLARSKIGRALVNGTTDQNCMSVLGALLTVVGEIGPYLHKRDENFTLDPALLQMVNTQLTNPHFPGNQYLATMVRRVLIDRRLPDEWLATAEQLAPRAPYMDLAKLRYLNEGLKPIDSFLFTLPVLRERYQVEVLSAPTAATHDVVGEFRDAYLDRDIAWGSTTLIDVGLTAQKKGKKGALVEADEIALLQWEPPTPNQNQLTFFAVKKPPPVKIVAKLLPKQWIDRTRVPKGRRMMVRGRFWEMNRAVTEVEVRDALLFEERDWSQVPMLIEPQVVNACPLAVNELSGMAPKQPGGFGQR